LVKHTSILNLLCLLLCLLVQYVYADFTTTNDNQNLMGIASQRPQAVISELAQPLDLAPYIESLEDPNRSMTFEEIQAGKYEGQWQLNNAPTFKGQNYKIRYWFRFTLTFKQDLTELKPVLLVPNQPQLLYELNVWIPQANGNPRQVSTGSLRRYEQRDKPDLRYVFQLPASKATYTVIGWVDNGKSALPPSLPLILLSNEQLFDAKSEMQGVLVAFYAVMVALLLYNACLFISLRQRLYFYYLFFLISAIFQCSFIDSTALRWLLPDDPMLHVRLAVVVGILMIFSYIIFVWEALEHVKFSVHLQKCFQIMFWLAGLGLIHNILTPFLDQAAVIVQVYPGIAVPLVLVTFIMAIRKGIPTAGYLLGAEICVLIGSSAFMLMLQGKLPINDVTSWSLHVSFLGESLLLSFALAARTRLAQEAAISNLKKYEKIYNDSIEGMFQFDAKSNSLKCNEAFAQLFGYARESDLSIRNNVFSYFEADIQAELQQLLAANGAIKSYEAAITNPQTKEKIWASVTMKAVQDSHGNFLGVEGFMIDIRERKLKEQAEKEQVKAKINQEISEAKNKAKTQFFASMSHEFRTPLTAILGYADIAGRADTTDIERLSHIKTITHSAQHLLQLINDILDLSKIEAQQLNIETLAVDPLQIAQDVYEFVSILATQKEISFNIDFQFPLPQRIVSDPTRLKQALINLCSNSVKFTAHGSVTLRISCNADLQQMHFAIEDTGIGLKPDQLQKLFKAYVQADSSTSRTYGGTGLGLHISKLIANKLGGDITAESEYGKGSTFTLSISTGPLNETLWLDNMPDWAPEISTEVAESTPTPLRADNKTPFTVLLADDNAVNQKLIGFHIKQLGAEVIIANDGLEAAAETIKGGIDLILMDMDMPIMDGMTAVIALRAKGFNMPIYALTGNVSPESIQECVDAGCQGHLAKPLDIKKLSDVIQSLQC